MSDVRFSCVSKFHIERVRKKFNVNERRIVDWLGLGLML